MEIDCETVSRIERGAVLPGLLRLAQIAIASKTGVAALLRGSSLAADGQALHLVQLLKNLDEADRFFAFDILKRFVDHRRLRAKCGQEAIADNRLIANRLEMAQVTVRLICFPTSQ